MTKIIKTWMRNQKLRELQEKENNISWMADRFNDEDIIKETEKAYQVSIEVSFSGISESFRNIWIPKTQIMTEGELKEEIEVEEKNYNNYKENKIALQKWAKETLKTRINASEKKIIEEAKKQNIEIDTALLSKWAMEDYKAIMA